MAVLCKLKESLRHLKFNGRTLFQEPRRSCMILFVTDLLYAVCHHDKNFMR
jgi:hypothetical protein